ncbi:tetratricopeptide repeat protein [Vibrio sp. E150_011]
MNTKWILLILTTTWLLGCASSNAPTDQEMVASMERVDNHEGLIQHYKGHLQQSPEDLKVTQELAKVYYGKGDIESARFYADHLLDKGVSNWQLYQLRGQIHDKRGEDKQAIERYLRSVDLGNKTSEIHVLSGISYSKLDNFERAEKQFNQARLKGHNDVAVKNNLAVVYLAQGKYARVTELLAPVFKENPSNEVVKANLAIAFFKLGQFGQARELLSGDYTETQVSLISRQLYNIDG